MPLFRRDLASFASLVLAGCVVVQQGMAQTGASAARVSPPAFHVDASWPKPLPNEWIVGQVSGIAVDARDHIWILHRPATLAADEKGPLRIRRLPNVAFPRLP
jgi:hypothetical protein